ncbi:hypothetical protein GCM10010260_39150 [Streptomyces filipinensis]|uniref:Uncharacterized protein n=1 Tax=Streptomyces filipinensis TaxID=66887 RepID=A0A918IDM5_9ACTN|nr:hypothetical protein GCM10010260_39150 [Streptomyces filipinensis]
MEALAFTVAADEQRNLWDALAHRLFRGTAVTAPAWNNAGSARFRFASPCVQLQALVLTARLYATRHPVLSAATRYPWASPRPAPSGSDAPTRVPR